MSDAVPPWPITFAPLYGFIGADGKWVDRTPNPVNHDWSSIQWPDMPVYNPDLAAPIKNDSRETFPARAMKDTALEGWRD